mgnify:CR=1 FL=1
MRRGEVWWLDLPPRRHGSEPAKARPVLVIQADSFNRSALATVIVACLTSELKWQSMPGNLRVSKRDSGLPRPSIVNVTQILAIDRSRLRDRVGTLPQRKMAEVDDGLRLVLGV